MQCTLALGGPALPLRRMVGGKPFAVRLCGKMTRGMRSLEYFTTHQVTPGEGGTREGQGG
jgi:hypothetical protein